ncbi:hypothetical protein AB0J83_30260 [Actinoplanes sp. NPDC049596]|uniref:hypothetical protein n=1 Tax=unclassified Actinoplanes TaxID=2626549 RepID=UPI003422E23E
MTATLGNILLVFLADRPGTAHELQQRHAQTFGRERSVDIARVLAALRRQDRLGHVGTEAANRPRSPLIFSLTDAGYARQRAWMLGVPPDVTGEDVIVRVLLATAAADRETFEAVIDSCLAALKRPSRRAATPVLEAHNALAEYEDALTASLRSWLRRLAGRPRVRDAA